MKIRSNSIRMPVVLAAGMVTAWSAAAQDMGSSSGGSTTTTGFYESGDAGVAIVQNITGQTGGSLQFDVGPRVNLRAGYNINENVAVELQGGFAYNTWSEFNGQVPTSAAGLWTVPLMVNGLYKHSFSDHWQGYWGVGVGGVISTLTARAGNIDQSTTDGNFGYQAIGGIKYLFDDHLELGLGYYFLGTLDHHWSIGTVSPTYMHSILLSLTYKF